MEYNPDTDRYEEQNTEGELIRFISGELVREYNKLGIDALALFIESEYEKIYV